MQKDYWGGFDVYEKGGSLWVVSKDMEMEEGFTVAGIRALRRLDAGFKPTTYMLQFLGRKLRKNIISLDEQKFKRIVLKRKRSERVPSLPSGYVALMYRNKIIGCGLVTPKGLESQIPKTRTKELRDVLEVNL